MDKELYREIAFDVVRALCENCELKRMVSPIQFDSVTSEDIELRRDFVQELALILLEKIDHERLVQLKAKGELGKFISGIIYRSANLSGGAFNRDYLRLRRMRKTFDDNEGDK